MCSCLAIKEGELWVQYAPTHCTWQIDQRVQNKLVSQPQPGITVQSGECGLQSALEGCGLETVYF